ncbi:alpha/beta fold hydrolase [Leptospira ellisii]|uniref:Alpha/beta fold hydrolase n=1 Tax=Leptospira ellisii TaxID=2023197 RepID=A0A2N0B2V1_9LEPT|nr:alpha/beta fold hydrolase [Leptospira ellisii]MDV6234389.1 alpha/beta fold hydrolase [Leptospira ellisii]PJZ90851.1 hypothetical protein CH379_21975 [Leptospira ellisii]PKA03739.1 hypothetical protein CH375_15185 [Leptospira ellisii]
MADVLGKKHGGIRIEQDEWEKPDYFQWEAALIRQVRQFTTQIPQTAILVGHSLGCLLIAKALEKVRRQISGILLVAPPDPDSPAFPPGLDEFHRLPNHPLSIPGAILYSENDRFANPEFVQKIAFQWGIEAISVGTLGHINSDSKLSDWEQGWEIFSRIFPKKQETAGKS